ncbi:unnamed protein product [Darwinula stevensoni]|uniref:Uncharacterized protein n=1 Tax=Darwinula stevensoni TaxID=69355 RepID=A0A7R8X5T2_9CRUS|nr:unnamed protein product [Darwinula stevensoni]CAG0887421.1 unnamed protein product [Darwinula stevensoni]
MAEDLPVNEDLSDSFISSWEQDAVQELESGSNLEAFIQSETDAMNQKLVYLFQNSATSIAQMYKDRHQGVSIWVPFQAAAGTVTSLYKESMEGIKRSRELGIQLGVHRRTGDILAWAKRRRRHIRREDLISFLAGKNPAPTPHSHWQFSSHHHHHRASPRPRHTPERRLSGDGNGEPDLHTFREALTLASLNSAMSNLGSLRGGASPPGIKRSPPHHHHYGELNAFMSEEFARHGVKRGASPPHDVVMDSPSLKRARFN